VKLTDKHRQHLKHLLFNDACSMYQAGCNHNAMDRSCCMDAWEDNIRSGDFKKLYETHEARYNKNLALNKDPDGAAGPDGHLVKGKLAFENAHLRPERDPGEQERIELTKEVVKEVEEYAEEFSTKYFDQYVERGGRA